MTDDKPSPAALARTLLRSVDSGILSTMSTALPGYPFGSVVPFVMTHDGRVAVYVSDIAQHTANVKANPKACLTVMQSGDGDQQALGRVTVIGDAVAVPESRRAGVHQRYCAFFPAARSYAGTHDFAYYWLEVVRVRYIGGFGRICWVEPADWSLAEPEWIESEQSIIDHMNADHGDSLVVMARHFAGLTADRVELLAVDVEGCHIRSDGEIRYLPFDQPCTTMDAVRGAMVRMARAAAAG